MQSKTTNEMVDDLLIYQEKLVSQDQHYGH
jgi:hypothetical protein